jgi:hypothetical protein
MGRKVGTGRTSLQAKRAESGSGTSRLKLVSVSVPLTSISTDQSPDASNRKKVAERRWRRVCTVVVLPGRASNFGIALKGHGAAIKHIVSRGVSQRLRLHSAPDE